MGYLMYVDVWSVVARRQREINGIEKLWKLKLVKKKPATLAIVTCYKVSNAILKHTLKAKVIFGALLWRLHT